MIERSLGTPSSPPFPPALSDSRAAVAADEGLDARVASLRRLLRDLGSCLVAYSGGVDSSVVLAVARQELGERAQAVIGRSATYATSELELALTQARGLGVEPRVLETAELDDPRFVSNPADRCYFCKGELYDRLALMAREEGYAAVVDGTNLDDLGDHRPGHRAAGERSVRSPLAQSGLRKADVRALAAQLGLPSADKPAMPCLASRFPYGSRITAEQLRQVEDGERWLREQGLRDVRLRHHGAVVRLEVGVSDLPRLVTEPFRTQCVAALKRLGFTYVALDLQGFRSGSLNEALAPSARAPLPLRIES